MLPARGSCASGLRLSSKSGRLSRGVRHGLDGRTSLGRAHGVTGHVGPRGGRVPGQVLRSGRGGPGSGPSPKSDRRERVGARAWLITGCTELDLWSHEVMNPTKTYEDLLDRAVALEKSGDVKHRSKKKLEVSDDEPKVAKKYGRLNAQLRKALSELGIRGKPAPTKRWCTKFL